MTHRQGQTRDRRIRWVVGSAVAALAAIAVFRLQSHQPTPHVAEMLSAHDTVGFVAVESPDLWLQAFDRAAAALPAAERQNLDARLSPQARTTLLGFDPATALGWQNAGVDPARGLALSLDARGGQGPLPASFLWVAGGPPHAAAADQLKWQTLAQWSVAAVSARQLADAPTASADAGPRLDRDPVLRAAFADMPTGARATFYAHADGILAVLRPHVDAKRLAGLEYVTQRVRGLSLVIAPERTAGRAILSSEGVESLRQIFGSDAPKQPFSPFLPHDGVLALRVSLNLPELFDGLMTWLPPQWLDARLGLASGRLGLLALVGLDWTQLERALSGHAVVALDLSVPPTPDAPLPWLGLLAVRDAQETDAALRHLAERSSQHGKPVAVTQIGGHAGWQSSDPAFVAVRVEGMLLIAPNRAIAEHALLQPQPMTALDDLDGDVVLGLVFRPLPAKPSMDAPSWPGIVALLEPMALAVRRDAHGLRLEASTFPLTSVVHLVSWYLRAKPGAF